MEQIWSLFKLLSEEQKDVLKSTCRGSSRSHEKFIYYLLLGETDEEVLVKKLKVSAASFNKIQSQCKDFLSGYIQKGLQTPLDEIQLVHELLLKGEIKTATKIYTALEKEYEEKQKWQLLDVLYLEGFRLGQITGNLKFIEDAAKKRNFYIDKHAQLSKLYGEVMVEMVRSEKFEDRKEDPKAYFRKIQEMNKRAYAIGHNTLIHNTLSILYNHHARFFNEPDKTWEIVQQVEANRQKFVSAFSPVTDAISRIILINFLCVYDGYGEPEAYLKETLKKIDAGGAMARANLIYALLGYYLSEGKTEMVLKHLDELEGIQDKTYFASFKSIVLAIQSFIDGNYTAFNFHYNLFYSDPNHIHLPDSEIIVRILELVILHIEKQDWLYKSKADAMRTYFNRNLNKTRYSEEYDILTYLITPSKKNREKLEKLKQSKYRSSKMLVSYVLKYIGSPDGLA
ncbi:MAG: hypothetical protein JWO06_1098 [Bacteroidota bacterium]|nr:hypothetical protein [Bacteroidota bacterium]